MMSAKLARTSRGMDTKPQTKCVLLVCFFLVLTVLAVYGQTARFGFVNCDDGVNVSENPAVEKGLSFRAAGWAFTHAQACNWIPLTTLSHMLDCQVFGLDAGGHHMVNVLWHAGNAVLLFLVLGQMTGSFWSSAFVAAVFAVHPLRVESVACVSERKDVLSGFFFLLTIGIYVRYVRQPSRAGYGLMALTLALGLLAKSMVATLPFVLLLLDYWPLGRLQNKGQFRRLFVEKVPLFILSAAGCAATALAPGLLVNARQISFLERLGNAAVSYVVYLRQTFFPTGLACLYPYLPNSQPLWKVGAAFAALAGISAGAVACRKKFPYLLTGWLWYLGMLLPVIGLVPISYDAAHADRYTYLPGIGLAIAVTWAVAHWSAHWHYRGMVVGGLSAVGLMVLVICAVIQTSYWHNSEALWSRALSCTGANTFARNGLGLALAGKGDWEGAIAQYDQALRIEPDNADARLNLGVVLDKLGRGEEAIAQYQRVLEIHPDSADARNNLGLVYFKKGNMEQAVAQYRKALVLAPDNAEARRNLGAALFTQGDLEQAVAQYRSALNINPEDAEARSNLGIALFAKGDVEGAIVQFRKAVQINPRYSDARSNLGVALFTLGNVEEAVAQYRGALESNPDNAKARKNLGDALAARGDVNEAITQYRRALELAMAQKNNDLIDKLQKKIKLYQADKPMWDAPRSTSSLKIKS
jgi:tetratricopeptide (TPR) repeat protein